MYKIPHERIEALPQGPIGCIVSMEHDGAITRGVYLNNLNGQVLGVAEFHRTDQILGRTIEHGMHMCQIDRIYDRPGESPRYEIETMNQRDARQHLMRDYQKVLFETQILSIAEMQNQLSAMDHP